MRKVLSKNPQVEQQRLHRRIFLDNVNPENQALMVRIASNYLPSVSYLLIHMCKIVISEIKCLLTKWKGRT